MKQLLILLMICFLLLISCGDDAKQYEDSGLEADQDLNLTTTNHPHGFKQSSCFHCHAKDNLHYNNNLAQILIDTDGETICYICHGSNGL